MTVPGDDWKTEASSWIGIKHRAAGSSSVFFGPFSTYLEFEQFCKENNLVLLAVELVDPASDSATWWDR